MLYPKSSTDHIASVFPAITSRLTLGAVIVLALATEATASPKPAITVTGNGVTIADGDTTPSVADDTEYGTVAVSGGTVTHTFTIENSGTMGAGDLILEQPVAVSGSDFTVTVQPALTTIPRGQQTTFQVQFDPAAVGPSVATVTIVSNVQGGTGTYTFSIQGTGSGGATAPTVTTPSVQNVTDTSADLGGDIFDTGGENPNERGVYWSTTQGFTPPGQGTKVSESGDFGAGEFFVPVTLVESDLYYFQAFATNSAGTDFTAEDAVQTEPTVQATGISFSAVTHNSMTVDWLPVDAGIDGSIVVMRAGASIPAASLPLDGSMHGDGSGAFESGDDLGSLSYVVYRGSAQTAPVTNLQPNTTYYVKVFSYAGSGTDPFAGINYQQDAPEENSQLTDPPPPVPTVGSPTIDAVEDTQATLGGQVTASTSLPITEKGVYWSTTSGFTPPGQGTKDFTTVSTSSLPYTFTEVTTLPESELIYFRAFALDGVGEGYAVEDSVQTEPSVQATGITFSGVTGSGMTVDWIASDAGIDGSIVVMRAGASIPAGSLPVDGNMHNDGSGAFQSGNDLGSQSYVVYRGSNQSAPVSNLQPDTTYYVKVFSYAGTGIDLYAGINYQQDAPQENSQLTAGPDPPTVTNLTIQNVEDTTAILGGDVTASNAPPVVETGVYWSTTQGFTPPGQGTKDFTSGADLGTGPFTESVALPQKSLIYFRAFATDGAGEGYSVAEGNLWTEPTGQASAITFPVVDATTMTISWTAGSGDGALVVVKEGTAVPITSLPLDGTEHGDGSNVFGAGDNLGDLSYVVYRGAANSVPISGLTAETTYWVKVFEYSGGAGNGINYQQDAPPENSQDTAAAAATSHNAIRNIQCDQCHALHSSILPRDAEQEAVCVYCHNATDMAGKPEKWDVAMHVVDGGTRTIDCGSCHVLHNYDFNTDNTSHGGVIAENILRIRSDTAKYVSGALEPAIFQQRPGHFAFFRADFSSGPFNGICQTCHQNTSNHTNDGWDADSDPLVQADNDHQYQGVCTTCHSHSDGFMPQGCTGCHATTQDKNDGAPTRRAIVGEFSTPNVSHHVDGASMTDGDCKVCHYEAVNGAYHQNNRVDLRDPDTGNPITLVSTGQGFTKFTRDRSSDTLEEWITTIQTEFCLKCHDGGANAGATATYNVDDGGTALRPFSSTNRDVPNVFDAFDPANSFHHGVRDAGDNPYCIPRASSNPAYNPTMDPPWNQDVTGGPYGDGHDMITCFDCHGDVVSDPDLTSNLISIHGGANQRMLRVSVDFDGIETAGTAGNSALIPANAGSETETFCTICHNVDVYLINSAPEDLGSVFPDHPGSQGQHGWAGSNPLGCMGCHAGIVDFSDLSGNGALRGNLHGNSFTWPGDSFASGSVTEHFMLGGWLSGWEIVSSTAYCRGGQCNHSNSSKNYPR